MSKPEGITDEEFIYVVVACRALPAAKGNYLIDDYIENLLLTVVDYMMRTTAVERAMQHYQKHRRDSIRTHQHLTQLLAQHPDTKEGNTQIAQYLWGYNLWTRVELLRRLVAYFDLCGVMSQQDLQTWAAQTEFKQFEGKVKGAGFAIFKWLTMRQGVETIKPDIWVHRFLRGAIGRSVNDTTAVHVLERAAQEIGLLAYKLDWAVWEHQRSLP